MAALTKYRTPSLLDLFYDEERRPESRKYRPAVAVRKNEAEYQLVAHLPGVRKEDLNIAVEDGVLKISGKVAAHAAEGYETIYDELHGAAEFERNLKIDARHFQVDRIEAKLSDGVLTVNLPVAEAVKPRQISVG